MDKKTTGNDNNEDDDEPVQMPTGIYGRVINFGKTLDQLADEEVEIKQTNITNVAANKLQEPINHFGRTIQGKLSDADVKLHPFNIPSAAFADMYETITPAFMAAALEDQPTSEEIKEALILTTTTKHQKEWETQENIYEESSPNLSNDIQPKYHTEGPIKDCIELEKNINQRDAAIKVNIEHIDNECASHKNNDNNDAHAVVNIAPEKEGTGSSDIDVTAPQNEAKHETCNNQKGHLHKKKRKPTKRRNKSNKHRLNTSLRMPMKHVSVTKSKKHRSISDSRVTLNKQPRRISRKTSDTTHIRVKHDKKHRSLGLKSRFQSKGGSDTNLLNVHKNPRTNNIPLKKGSSNTECRSVIVKNLDKQKNMISPVENNSIVVAAASKTPSKEKAIGYARKSSSRHGAKRKRSKIKRSTKEKSKNHKGKI